MLEKLREVEGHWTRGNRVELTTEAATALWAFGSDRVRDLAARWITARCGQRGRDAPDRC